MRRNGQMGICICFIVFMSFTFSCKTTDIKVRQSSVKDESTPSETAKEPTETTKNSAEILLQIKQIFDNKDNVAIPDIYDASDVIESTSRIITLEKDPSGSTCESYKKLLKVETDKVFNNGSDTQRQLSNLLSFKDDGICGGDCMNYTMQIGENSKEVQKFLLSVVKKPYRDILSKIFSNKNFNANYYRFASYVTEPCIEFGAGDVIIIGTDNQVLIINLGIVSG